MEEKWTRVVIHDPHGNSVADRPLSPEGATEQISEHNDDQEAHPYLQGQIEGAETAAKTYADGKVSEHNASQSAHSDIREALQGQITQIGNRITDLVIVKRDGMEESKAEVDGQGNKIAVLNEADLGKVAGIVVNDNEEDEPIDSDGKVHLTIPQNVTDLEDGDQYATKEYADARTIGEVTATVIVGEETKTATVTKDGSDVHIAFPNLQGPPGIGIQGIQGPPGADRQPVESGDVIIAHTTGQDDGKVMSQKAVTDALNDITSTSPLSSSTYAVPASAQNRAVLYPGLEVGKTYLFKVSVENAAAANITVNLYVNSNTSTNTYVGVGQLLQGETEAVFEYTPQDSTNYQVIGFWSTVAANVTVAYSEKMDLSAVKDEADELSRKLLEQSFGNSDVTWERGNINGTTGANATNTTMVRTAGYIVINEDFDVANETGYNLYLRFYENNGAYIGGSESIVHRKKFQLSDITSGKSIRVRMVLYNPAAAISIDETSTLQWGIKTTTIISSEIEKVEEKLEPIVYGVSDFLWARGNIDPTTGADTSNSQTLRTSTFLEMAEDFIVWNNTDWLMAVFSYEADGTFIRQEPMVKGSRRYALSDITNGDSAKFRVVFYGSGTVPGVDIREGDWGFRTIPGFEKMIPRGIEDYSHVETVEIPIPDSMPRINISVSSLPTAKGQTRSAYLEYIHHSAYFFKLIELDAQGSSSMAYMQKNLAIDLMDGSTIKFGNWVPQDSFHLKCYWIDVLRGYNNIALNYVEEVIKYKNCRANRNIIETTKDNGSGVFARDFDCALCHPDGFPCEVWVNGEYYGVYVWNIKKHRDNYSMKKNDYTQVHLDGEIDETSLFGNTIKWTDFEIRNPKKLILMDGTTEYDGDNPAEIIGEGDPNYDESVSDMKKTAITKAAIKRLADARANILAESGAEARRAKFEEYFDVEMMLVYAVLSNAIDNFDGYKKNWQWLCYDGIWSPNFYDMDSLFGRHWTGAYVWRQPNVHLKLAADNTLMGIFYGLYETEIKALWKELRDNGMISTDHIMQYVYDWMNKVGREALERNLERWPQIPSYREDNPETNYTDGTATYSTANRGMYDSPTRIRKWLQEHIAYIDVLLGYNQ